MTQCNGCKFTMMECILCFSDKGVDVLDFLVAHGVVEATVNCERCSSICHVRITEKDKCDSRWLFRCTKRVRGKGRQRGMRVPCGFWRSARTGTFLGETRLSPPKVTLFCNYWLHLTRPTQMFFMQELKISKTSIVEWSNHCDEVCIEWVLQNSHPIGGPGTTVDILEAKVKFSRRQKEGQWMFTGIERCTPCNFFMVPVASRDESTLLKVLQTNILPETTVGSSCWGRYVNLRSEGYQLLRVNSAIQFVDSRIRGKIPEEGPICMQNITKLSTKVKSDGAGQNYLLAGNLAKEIFKCNFPSEEWLHQFFLQAARLYANK